MSLRQKEHGSVRDIEALSESWPLCDRRRTFCVGLVVSLAATGLVGGGLWAGSQAWGREDWDYFAHQYEACGKTLLEYGQYPWWNPWNCGGMPLAANPQVGVISLTFLLTVVFGTWTGLMLAVVIHELLAAAGAFVLAWEVTGRAAPSIAGACIYACNGAAALSFAAGHLGVLGYAWLPWVVLFGRWCRNDSRWGWTVGACLAIATLASVHYVTVFLYVVVAALFGWYLVLGGRRTRYVLATAGLCAGLIVVALCSRRLLLCGQLVLENPRPAFAMVRTAFTPGAVLAAMVDREPDLDFAPEKLGLGRDLAWHEYGLYVGWPAVVLLLASFRNGWRWWHTFVLAGWLLAAGNTHWYHPSAWLGELPVFSAMRVVTRWRILAALGIAVGVAAGLAAAPLIRRHWATPFVALAVIIDVGSYAWRIHARAFVIPSQPRSSTPLSGTIGQLEWDHPPPGTWSAIFPTVAIGYGVIQGYEPLVAQYDENKSTIGEGRAEYRGEFGPREAVTQLEWSPNRVVLTGPPGTSVWINQNPGSYWRVGSRRPFDSQPVVDRSRPFEFVIPPQGRVELEIDPPLRIFGAVFNVAGGLAAVGWAVFQRYGRAIRNTAARRPGGDA
jgi:hypothetical protein